MELVKILSSVIKENVNPRMRLTEISNKLMTSRQASRFLKYGFFRFLSFKEAHQFIGEKNSFSFSDAM